MSRRSSTVNPRNLDREISLEIELPEPTRAARPPDPVAAPDRRPLRAVLDGVDSARPVELEMRPEVVRAGPRGRGARERRRTRVRLGASARRTRRRSSPRRTRMRLPFAAWIGMAWALVMAGDMLSGG
jgi:hypothetical protein